MMNNISSASSSHTNLRHIGAAMMMGNVGHHHHHLNNQQQQQQHPNQIQQQHSHHHQQQQQHNQTATNLFPTLALGAAAAAAVTQGSNATSANVMAVLANAAARSPFKLVTTGGGTSQSFGC